MKIPKIFVLILSFILSFSSLFGCNNNNLQNNVSELRKDVFLANLESDNKENLTLKGACGFIEKPYALDGKTGETIGFLKFNLSGDVSENVSYSLAFTHDDFNYKKEFTFSPTSNAFTAFFEIDNFSLKEFNVNLFIGAKSYPVALKSIVPNDILSYDKALEKLKENQPSLIAQKTDENGNFNAEIFMRVLVKNEYPYWYIGISHEKAIKAMLMDAKTGKILAVRDVF